MLFTITERNSWEKESWIYLLDMEKQDAEAIKWLMLFIRLNNEVSKEAYDKAPVQNIGGPFSRPFKMVAVSTYILYFWDEIMEDREQYTKIMRRYGKEGKTVMKVNKNGDYKSGGNFTNFKISMAKMKSAAVTIRDKKENKLYKNFEAIFYAKQLVTA